MENILVSIRVRPLSRQEASKGTPWKLTPNSIALSSGASTSGQTYNFDRVFDPSSKTLDIYDAHTKKIISSAVQGFNGTIFAYGQTSSGKTYTMRGSPDEPGIIPLAVQDVFRNTELSKDREFLLRVSYMEIYNEEIKDLLSPENTKLQIHENFERGIFVAGLQEEIVDSPEHVLALMDKGEAHRHVGETNMNVHSSRSHTIFRMVIESRDRSQDIDHPEDREILQNSDPVRVSHLNLVDLAGSERVSKTGAEGARLKEGTHINKSLMTLGNVINKLSEGIEKQGGHVPYRDSKLTRILQPALGGNARTVIICNITPAWVHADETRGTLQFASRANRVTNCAQVNEIVTDAALLKRQKKEIAELRQKLQNQESPSEQFEEEIRNLRNQLLKTELEKEQRIKEQEQKIQNLSTMVINSAVDDREFVKRSKRNNRRETWCARPQSGLLPLLPDLKTVSEKLVPETPKTTASELPVNVRRERSFGLPPPFEALMEEDEDMFTMGTSSSFDEDLQDRFSMIDGFILPEPGPKSSVANRRRRSSNDWIVGNELEQQFLELQGQYDALQFDHVIKMSEKDREIDKLKTELTQTQLNLSKAGKNSHKKVQDFERRGKSLEGLKESESTTKIKQLRAQVGRLETEKLYMGRELERLEDQAGEQADMSRQYLEEVYEELNLAKETCAKLNAQLDTTLQEIQQLQMDKRDDEVLNSQLSFVLEDLNTEFDDIRKLSGEIIQECLAGARDLSTHVVNENSNAKLLSLTLKPCPSEDWNNLVPAVDNLHMQLEHATSAKESLLLRKATLQDEFKSLKTSLPEMEDEKCSLSEANLLDERQAVLSAINSLQVQIENAHSQRESLLRRKAEVQDELENLKTCIQVMEDERSSLSETLLHGEGERNTLLSAVNGLQTEIQHAVSEKESLLQRKVNLQHELENMRTCLQEMDNEKSSSSGKPLLEERKALLSAVNSLQVQIENAHSERESLRLREAVLQDELENMKTRIQAMEDERSSLSETHLYREGERNTLLSAVNDLQTEIQHAVSEKESLLQRKGSLQNDLENLRTCLQEMDDEKSSLSGKKLLEERKTLLSAVNSLQVHIENAHSERESLRLREAVLQDELENLKTRIQAMEDERSSLSKTHLHGERERNALLSAVKSLQTEVEHATSDKEGLLRRKAVLQEELDNLTTCVQVMECEKSSFSAEVASLKSSVEEMKDDRKLWMKVSEERLADVERLKVELENTRRIFLSTSEELAASQELVSDLNSSLAQKLDEVDMLNKKLEDVEQQKITLTRTAGELEGQLEDVRATAEKAFEEMEGWQQRYQTDSTHFRAEIASLRKELSTAKTLPGALLKERDSLHKDLEKTKSKMKDAEAKLKTTIQDKNKLETEKVHMERELKHLRQSNVLQRDISRRDSIVDQRRQSIALVVNKTKTQLSSVELALQLKTEEVDKLTYQLSESQESYAKLEFAMAEAESYSNEKVAELERALAAMNDETTAAKALVANITNEKEDIVEELLDAHISFQREKAELAAQAQESREKCDTLNQDVVLLTEDLQKLKKLQEEASDSNRLLQEKLQQVLETNTEKSLAHQKLLKELETEVDSYKEQFSEVQEQCKDLHQQLALGQKQEQDLRSSLSSQLEQLRHELQQFTMKLSTARDEEQMLLMENRSLLNANVKLQAAFDGARGRLEIFEGRFEESQWELEEFKSSLRKAGFVGGDEWNFGSLQEFQKRIKDQNDEARKLETELAGKKMEIIDLEVQLESMRALCEKYQEEVEYLKTRVLTPEQETGVREIVRENKKFQVQLKRTEEKAQELKEMVKAKDVSMNTLQVTLGSIRGQNSKLEKDLAAAKAELESLRPILTQNEKLEKGLAASKAELESVQRLHKIAMRAGALMSNSKPTRPEKLQPVATAQSSISLPSELSRSSGTSTFRPESTCTESSLPSLPGYRMPMGERSSNESPPCLTERKRARLFPASERSKFSRSLGLGPRYFGLPESRFHLDMNKENI